MYAELYGLQNTLHLTSVGVPSGASEVRGA